MNSTNNELVDLKKKVAKLSEGTNIAYLKKIRYEIKSLKANITDLFKRSNLPFFTPTQEEKQNGAAKDFELELQNKKLLWKRYDELKAGHKRHFDMLETLNQELKGVHNHAQKLKLTSKEQQKWITSEAIKTDHHFKCLKTHKIMLNQQHQRLSTQDVASVVHENYFLTRCQNNSKLFSTLK